MNVIEYVSVFVSIVLGLALAELATGVHRLIRAWRRVRWDWISPALALMMLLEIVQFWWLAHGWYGARGGLRLVEFLPDLTLFLLIYLMAAAVLPDEIPDRGLDLRQFYVESARHFWALAILLTIGLIVIAGPRASGSHDVLTIARAQALNLFVLAILVPLLIVRNIRLHQIVTVLLLSIVSWVYLHGLRDLASPGQ